MPLFLCIAFVFVINKAYADIGSDLDNYFVGLGYSSNTTNPASYQGQQAGYYMGGSLLIRDKAYDKKIAGIELPCYRQRSGGIDAVIDEEIEREEKDIKAFGEKNVIFFIYRGNCPECRICASNVKQFSRCYKINVVPFTIDGISLPEFPNSYIVKGSVSTFQVKSEPVIFVVNPDIKIVIPMRHGLSGCTDFRQKILEVSDQLRDSKRD